MKKILSETNKSGKKISFDIENMNDLFLPQLRKVYDCIVISKKDIKFNSEDEFIRTIQKMHMDKTGYEACNTETMVNYYIEDNQLELSDIIFCAHTIINVWEKQIKLIDNKSKFCFIISADLEYKSVTIRFHKVREDESMWLSDDIEAYSEPVSYKIS